MQVITLRRINAGEEVNHDKLQPVILLTTASRTQILTAYIDTTLPRAMRQNSLKETYNFVCTCRLCSVQVEVDPRESLWCPKTCGGICPVPTEG